MLHKGCLAAAGNHTELLDAGGAGFFHRILDQWLVHDREHFLRYGLGGGQESGSQTGHGENSFAQLLDHRSTPIQITSKHHPGRAKMWRRAKSSPFANRRETVHELGTFMWDNRTSYPSKIS